MTEQSPSHREFLEFALERFAFEYDQLLDAWKQIDAKAQSTATIAGIFLAATFAFVRSSSATVPRVQAIAICLTAACLVLTIAVSVAVMLIKPTFVPLTGSQVAEMVAHALAQPPTEAGQRYNGLLADTVDSWGAVNKHLRLGLEPKTRRLAWSQRLLLLSSIIVLGTTVLSLA